MCVCVCCSFPVRQRLLLYPAVSSLHRASRKVDIRLSGKMISNSHGTRPVHQIITMMKWIRTSMLSMKHSLSQSFAPNVRALDGRGHASKGKRPSSDQLHTALDDTFASQLALQLNGALQRKRRCFARAAAFARASSHPNTTHAHRSCARHGVSSSLLGPVHPSFRALSGRLKLTVRRHKFNEDSPSTAGGVR